MDAAVWIVAGLEVVAALGIAAYWITWFREPHDEPWLPGGYVDHEAPFVFTDTILAVVLVVAAVLQVIEKPLGDSLGLIAAGMLAFLGILDLAYFARTGLFKREHDGLVNGGVVAGVLLLSVILILRFI
jgi:hypothetical protein